MRPSLFAITTFCGLFSLLGCAALPATHPTSSLSGSVRGGQQPVSGATIQLYAVGTSGIASAATPLLTQPVLSDSNGAFSITNLYSCPTGALVYLTATGGNPGTSAPNPNLALMTALSSCSSLTPSTFIMVDERTTVAAVGAITSFMTSFTNVGASSFTASGLQYDFLLSSYFSNPSTGTTPGLDIPLGTTVPSEKINTLANVISACVNSEGGVAGESSPCGQLFALTTSSGGVAPIDTVGALVSLQSDTALSVNTAALFNLIPPNAPFQPQLSQPPTNFGIQLASGFVEFFAPVDDLIFPDTGVGTISAPMTFSVTTLSGGPVGRPLQAQSSDSSFVLTSPSICPNSNTQVCTFSVVYAPKQSTNILGTVGAILIYDPTDAVSGGIEVYVQGRATPFH